MFEDDLLIIMHSAVSLNCCGLLLLPKFRPNQLNVKSD